MSAIRKQRQTACPNSANYFGGQNGLIVISIEYKYRFIQFGICRVEAWGILPLTVLNRAEKGYRIGQGTTPNIFFPAET